MGGDYPFRGILNYRGVPLFAWSGRAAEKTLVVSGAPMTLQDISAEVEVF